MRFGSIATVYVGPHARISTRINRYTLIVYLAGDVRSVFIVGTNVPVIYQCFHVEQFANSLCLW